jgi:hypothetical protein
MRQWKLLVVITFLAIFSLLNLSKTSANTGQPPLANTGAPGEQRCLSCHNSFAIDSGKGQVAITGLPREYVAGMKYDLTVFLADTESSRWGFELVILDGNGVSVGTLVSADETFATVRNQAVGSNTRSYLVPTIAGNFTGRIDVAMWNFSWTAPQQDVGNITFQLIGVAADRDGTPRGDDVYTNIYNLKLFVPKPPELNFINPPRGPSTGQTKVTIGGLNFRPGVKVFFDDLETPTELLNEGTLVVNTPPHDVGLVPIRITNSDGMTNVFPNAFEYVTPPPPGPVLNFTSPSSGPTSGGTSVRISGSNFQRGSRIIWNNRELSATFIDTNFLMVTTPLNNPGPIPVVVINPDGQTAELNPGFTYEGTEPPPIVKLVVPENTISAGGAPTTIRWTIDSNGTPFQRLLLSTDGGNSFPIVLANNLTANISHFNWLVPEELVTERARIRLEVVQPNITVSDEIRQDFKIVAAPKITSMTPATAKADKTKLTAELRGQGFVQGAIVEMDGVRLKVASITPTVIKLKKVPHTIPGYHFVRVKNPNGGISRTFIFTVAQ